MQFFSHINRFSLPALPLALALCAVPASAQEPNPEPTPPPVPQISIKDAKVKEGNSGESKLEFEVSLSKVSTKAIKVDYRTFGRTASGTTDFTNIQGTLSFPAGVKAKLVTVKVKGDTKAEDNETLIVKLTNSKNALVRDSEGLGTIINDDGIPKAAAGSGKIVYASSDGINPGIYIINSDGTNRTRLTSSFNDYAPIWSPDGKKVVYRSYISVGGASGNGLAVVDADGKNQRPLYIDEVRSQGRVNWTADSKAILCTPSNGSGLVKVSVSDAKVTTLVQSGFVGEPDATQKSGKIVYYAYDDASVSPTYRSQIFIMNGDGSVKTRLTSDDEADSTDPQVSTDGKVIIFLKRTQRTIGVYAMDGEGKNQRLLLETITDGFDYSVEGPHLSENGKKALFSVVFQEQRTYYVADVKSGVVRELPLGESASTSNPDLNPDGSLIVFHSTRDGNYEIYSIHSDGTKLKRITNNEIFDIQPDLTDGLVPTPKSSSSSASSAAAAVKTAPSANSS